MKKIVFTSILLATVFIVLKDIDAFQKIEEIKIVSTSNSELKKSIYTVKYEDCIHKSGFPDNDALFSNETSADVAESFVKVDASLKKYKKSLDSTIKNLSVVDAHDFIHQTFKKTRIAIANKNISDIQKHYYFGIMQICYDSDKYLNQNAVGRL
ncbi:hypothetical protein [Allomuricauda sp. F6463D]|uniref:hypothetical protein n=1 Tax=Allomuricauda sp. F6463D TaxID=2926409 RepID=UPI001FF25F72|nr:hypothetical protein [Muricauda sp. F6463D]MCK0160602.1 hypothetical protein [Muricauda sp. F6463D]